MKVIADIDDANKYVDDNKSKVVFVVYNGSEVTVYEEGDSLPVIS
jgi:hypothetical protein